MKLRSLLLIACLAGTMLPATVARADDDDIPEIDARTQGYPDGVTTHMESGSDIGAYFIFFPLMLLTVGVMLKNSNRSHLD